MRTHFILRATGVASVALALHASGCGSKADGTTGGDRGTGGASEATSASTSSAASTSTSTSASVSVGSTSSSGATTGAGGGSCAGDPDAGAVCNACCAAQDPAGVTALLDDGADCVCSSKGCASECPDLCASLDGGASADAGAGDQDGGAFGGSECQSCVTALLQTSSSCLTAALVKCDKDTDCKAFVACEEGCTKQ